MSEIVTDGERNALLKRIYVSPQLHSSPKLRELLAYLSECEARKHPEEASEQQIGVHVFGKQPGYNSSEDSLVRSQVRLLRLKLAAYFEQEGLQEEVVLSIPKGQYLPSYQLRSISIANVDSPGVLPQADLLSEGVSLETPSAVPGERVLPGGQPWRSLSTTLGLMLAMGLIGVFAGLHFSIHPGRLFAGKEPLWDPFQTPTAQTLVIYSNPVFVGTLEKGLRLAPLSSAGQTGANDPVDDTYTGTGEVEAIYRLTRFFDLSGSQFQLKRSRMVTWDEARSRNLIFIGAPSQNTALYDLPSLTKFTIRLDPQARGYIQNQSPSAQEPLTFGGFGNPEEFAIVALLPGLQSGRKILLFAGLTTSGTQAAVEFACSPEGEATLMQKARLDNGLSRPFEAVLRVRTSQHVSMGTEIVAFHSR